MSFCGFKWFRQQQQRGKRLTWPHIYIIITRWREKLISATYGKEDEAAYTYRNAVPVGCLVELVEQEEEHNGVHADPPDKSFWIIAVNEEQLEGVNHDQNKLNLQGTKEKKKEVFK